MFGIGREGQGSIPLVRLIRHFFVHFPSWARFSFTSVVMLSVIGN